jgi:hypothetical protein
MSQTWGCMGTSGSTRPINSCVSVGSAPDVLSLSLWERGRTILSTFQPTLAFYQTTV